MRTNDKCCGNCLHFHNEDIEGRGWCYKRDTARHCSDSCGYYETSTKKQSDMNILKIIEKAPKDHVHWCTLIGECKVRIATLTTSYPIIAITNTGCEYEITKSGRYFYEYPDAECILFPSRDNRDWAAFERELDGKPKEKKPIYFPESESFNGSIEMVSIPDRPMMAAVICAGLLAGRCKDEGAALINKAVNYADMILDYTKEGSNDKC